MVLFMLHSGTHDTVAQSVLNYHCLPFIFYFSPPTFLLCTIMKQQILRTAPCISRLYYSVFLSVEYFKMYILRNKFFFGCRMGNFYWEFHVTDVPEHVMVSPPQKHAHQKFISRSSDMVMLYLFSCLILSWNNKLSACCYSFLNSVIN